MIFHNGSDCDYHFITKNPPQEFKGQINVQEKILKNTYPFQLQQRKKLKEFVKMREITKTVFYQLQFIDNARFMTSSLSTLIYNLAEGIHNSKCKSGLDHKQKAKPSGIKYKNYECSLKYTSVS